MPALLSICQPVFVALAAKIQIPYPVDSATMSRVCQETCYLPLSWLAVPKLDAWRVPWREMPSPLPGAED